MSVARGAAVGAIAAAAIVIGLVLLGGGGGHEYNIRFLTAGQLVKGDDVQVGGRRIGSIEGIKLTENNQAEVKVSVDDEFAPLPATTKATVRLTSLSGVANRYIELALGPNNGEKLADGATIAEDRNTSVVDIDQLFNTLDAPTRRGLQGFFRGQGQWYKGKGPEANLAAYYFNPAISTSTQVFDELSADQKTFAQAITATAKAMGAIASRKDDLTNLITNSNSFASAIASENESFAQALSALPKTLRRANTTFVDLRGTLDQVQQLIDVSKPNTVDLPEFFAALRPAASNAVPVFTQLANIISKPGAANDLTYVMQNAPAMQKLANEGDHSAFPEGIQSLQAGQKTIEFARPYTVDLVGWMRELGGVTSFYDANGHFARFSPVFNSYKVNGSGQFEELNANERFSIYGDSAFDSPYGHKGSMNFNRCPGSASQLPVGQEAAWRAFFDQSLLNPQAKGCNPDQVPPGS